MSTIEERLAGIEAILPSFATKEDLGRLETRLASIEATLPSFATKGDLAHLEARITRWMVGLMLASIVGASSIAYAVVRLFG